jgi:hypothetical protein
MAGSMLLGDPQLACLWCVFAHGAMICQTGGTDLDNTRTDRRPKTEALVQTECGVSARLTPTPTWSLEAF